MRSEASTFSRGSPIACKTWLGSIAPEEHAEPLEIATPSRSSAVSRLCAGTPVKPPFSVLGSRVLPEPRDQVVAQFRQAAAQRLALGGDPLHRRAEALGEENAFRARAAAAFLGAAEHERGKRRFPAAGQRANAFRAARPKACTASVWNRMRSRPSARRSAAPNSASG
jgi:hypothetical protein